MAYHGKHFFIALRGEDFTIGWYPWRRFDLRWKSAEDGRTWIWPTFGIYGY